MRLKIDGEIYNVSKVYQFDRDHNIAQVKTEEGPEFIVAESSEEAGKSARERWADMAENDPKEFTCMVGEETLVQWGLGRSAGPGSTSVCSLEEWLDLWLDTPEEEFASYD